MTHSPTPWKVMEYKPAGWHGNPIFKRAIFSEKTRKPHNPVCIILSQRSERNAKDNLNLVLKACNNHDALVDALNKCVHALEAASATMPFQGKINSMAHCMVDDAKMRADELLKQMGGK